MGVDDAFVERRHRSFPHYHGDAVRTAFFVSALLLVVAESTGAALPLSARSAVIAAVILVIAAGITNPMYSWIHWLNALLAILGTIIFGSSAVEHYRFDNGSGGTFIYVEALALLSLVALYFTTRSLRAMIMRPRLN